MPVLDVENKTSNTKKYTQLDPAVGICEGYKPSLWY